MKQASRPRSYIVGLSIGTFWLVAASTGFAILMLALAGTAAAQIAIIALALAGVTFLVLCFRQILAAMKLPREPKIPDGRRIGRTFAMLVAAEVLGILIANTVCYFTDHMSLLVPVDLIVIGIHFLPLAKLFAVPRYTMLGVLFCASAVFTVAAVPPDAHAGAAVARFLISTMGAAAAAWAVSIASLIELRRLLSGVRLV